MKLKYLRHSTDLVIYFCMIFFFAKVKIFSFWSKTMDYNYSQAFRPKLRSFFAVILLHCPHWNVL